MSIRISTLGVRLFRLHDLEVHEPWLVVSSLTEKQRQALIAHAGRYVQVHADDLLKLSEFRLAAELDTEGKRTGRVVEDKKPTTKTGTAGKKE